MTIAGRPTLLRHLWKSALASGVVAVIVGVLVLVWPGISILVTAVLFGAYLLISGFTQVFSAFTQHVSGAGRVLLFVSGAASLILAVLAFRHFGDAVLLLAIWIGIGFIFRGVATTVSAISDAGAPGRVWQIVSGGIAIVAGIVVMGWPFTSLVTLALVAGIWLIVTGIIEVVSSFAIRRAAKNLEGFRETRAQTRNTTPKVTPNRP
jgi:uncharacterized membrane protein HdeD (DUF308 family)